MHVTQYQKNEPDVPAFAANNPEYVLEVCIYDANQVLLNKFDGEDGCGNFVALNGQPQAIVTALPNLMYITVGAMDDDAVLFTYGDQDWGVMIRNIIRILGLMMVGRGTGTLALAAQLRSGSMFLGRRVSRFAWQQ